MIKYIIFDLDGVLANARELHYEALNAALADFGYTITRDEHLSTYDGLPTKKKLEMLTEQKGLPPDLYNNIWQAKQDKTIEIIDKQFVYDERLRKILKQLKEDGYRIAVCSNSVRESTKMMLLRKGFLDYLDFYFSNQDVQNPKPNPEMFLRAMVKWGASPKECLIIEDSHHGRKAAHLSGAFLCGVENVEDVTYEKIKGCLERINSAHFHKKFVPKWQGGDLRIVIPLAGAGKSFKASGFSFPKPLIDIKGKPMIQWVIENINVDGKFIFIVLREHFEKYHLKYLLNLIAPGCEIVVLDKLTRGAAVSVLMARRLFKDDKPIAVVNSDQLIEWDSNEFFYAMAADECDGGIVSFESTHPKWSFIKIGQNGFVTEVAEKIPISNQATAGVYYFKKGSDFINYAIQMIKAGINTNGEYFVCPIYNEMIKDEKKIRAFPVEKVWSFATPEDLEVFLREYKA